WSLAGLFGMGAIALLFGGCMTGVPTTLPTSRDTPFSLGLPDQDDPVVRQQTTRVARSQRPEASPVPDNLPNERGRIQIRAWVNGKPIFDDEVTLGVMQQGKAFLDKPEPLRSTLQTKIRSEVLNNLIDRELLWQDAMTKLEKNPKFLDKLRAAAAKEFE